MQETQVPSMGQEDPLEEEIPTHSSILAWRIPWTEETGGLQSIGLQSQTRLKRLKHSTALDLAGEGRVFPNHHQGKHDSPNGLCSWQSQQLPGPHGKVVILPQCTHWLPQ